MQILALDAAGMSVLSLDDLLHAHPDRYALLCSVVGRGGSPTLSGQIAGRDSAAAYKFLARLDQVLTLEQREFRRLKIEAHRSPVLSGIARAKAHNILGELE